MRGNVPRAGGFHVPGVAIILGGRIGRSDAMTEAKPPENRDEQRERPTKILAFLGGRLRPIEILALLVVVAAYLLAGYLLWLFLNGYIQPGDSSQKKKDLVQALGLIMAGLAGVIGIYLTWRGQRITQRDQEENRRNTQAQLENAREELRLTRQGQMTERFTKAIEQLGSGNLEIRLGGIYSLERTAQEERNYHWPVMEVLTNYVRRCAPRKGSGENPDPPKPDVHAILDVIGRRSEHHRNDEKVEYGTIDLSLTDLRRTDLSNSHLEGAQLGAAQLDGARLARAHLEGANLYLASLEKAYLLRADLRGADLGGADLRGAILADADLSGANLEGADLRGADLRGALNLTPEQLDRAHVDESTQLPSYLATGGP